MGNLSHGSWPWDRNFNRISTECMFIVIIIIFSVLAVIAVEVIAARVMVEFAVGALVVVLWFWC